MYKKTFQCFILFYAFIVINCFNFSTTPNSHDMKIKDESNCDELLEGFALASANYTFCAIRFARPIRLCEFCVEKYQRVEEVYNQILTIDDDEGETCRAKLINLDRLQVVESGFNYVAGMWKRASCNKCLETDENNSPTKDLNENTKEILELSNKTRACIDDHRNDTFTDPQICNICKPFYLELNSRYDSLKEQGFCMDIVDLMNSTRNQWSIELGCCLDRKQPEWLFLVSSFVFTCLPLAFYLAAFLFVTRKEQTVLKQRRLQGHINTVASTSSVMYPD